MRLLTMLCCCLLLTNIQLKAQSSGRDYHGQVITAPKTPVPYASVVLLSAVDSSRIKGAVADNEGYFTIRDIPALPALLRVTAMGYESRYITLTDISKQQQLLLEARMEKEVVITGNTRKPLVNIRPDGIVMNVASSINATGLNLIDLLRKAPGVMVSGEDKITVSGKSGILVYIDGVQINLSGADLADYLKGIPSDNIATIQIVTTPGARFDAAGNAGIILIKTKKLTQPGFNGNVAITAGIGNYYPKFNGSASFNYKTGKFNTYGSFSNINSLNRYSRHNVREQETNQQLVSFDQQWNNRNRRNSYNYKIGTDYSINAESTVGISLDGNINRNGFDATSQTLIYQQSPQLPDSTLIARNVTHFRPYNNTLSGSYTYLDTTGRELAITASYGANKKAADAWLPNTYFHPDGTPGYSTAFTNQHRANYTFGAARADYRQKLGLGNLETGIKFSDVQSDNDMRFYSIQADQHLPDTGRTNRFLYKEIITAGYFSYSFKLKRFSFVLGLRGEHTAGNGQLYSLKGNQLQAVDTAFFNLFPNILTTWKFHPQHNVSLSYNRRIDRPTYLSLNPFLFVMDELSYETGNPFLRPMFSDNLKLIWIYQEKYSAAISYSATHDMILEYADTLYGGRTFNTYVNVPYKHQVSLDLNASKNITSFWQAACGLNAFYMEVSNIHQAKNTSAIHRFTWTAYLNNSFSLPRKWSIELYGFYNAPFLDIPALVTSNCALDIGIQKKLLQDAGVFKLTVSDIFNGLNYDATRNYGGLSYRNISHWENRVLRLSFSYRFGNKNMKSPESRDSGAKDVKNRM
ncbi:outer membrane receptor protein involved in Fe transport [Chitinophaga dinghuensis]|uniref:Outer membrane receptor protein involved in Fe transport n=1 Tax=Chitinophaga dinghuensis TaxID=1539050 RepID=A0A327VYS8_9BACT|nr:outer membrane beta-barrel protein [Chitinophaga dinghuensis]RAJ80045.1 outer membrane receptor protein involved in Fe transport [Chitinophaga dinghuensis]